MNENMHEIDKDSSQIHILEGSEEVIVDEVQVDLEEERKHIQEQGETEEFWAGRNLAARNSTRRAA